MRGETPDCETPDCEAPDCKTPDCEAPRRSGGIGRPLPRQRSKPLNAGVGRGPKGAAALKEHARPVRPPT